jgi:hypothetical protein
MESLLKGMNEQLSPYIYILFIYLMRIYMHFGFFSRRQQDYIHPKVGILELHEKG